MKQQAEYIKRSTDREKAIYDRESQEEMAALENTFAKSGIAMTGTALELRSQEELQRQSELQSIVDQGNMNIQEAYMKASSSKKNADSLASFERNGLQTATTLVNARTSYLSAKGKVK